MKGYIKLYRSMLENPLLTKDSDYMAIWVYLLLNATHAQITAMFKGEIITLKEGQLITGRKSISKKLNINETKVQRVLKRLENEQQIEQQTSNRKRLVTVVNFKTYQQSEQQSEQQVNNKRTTSEQQVNTNKNVKNVKNVKERDFGDIAYSDIIKYLNNKTEKNFKATTAKTKELIKARWNEGQRLDDFKKVIDTKTKEWSKDPKMAKYLRPETLFGTKFESYRNEETKKPKSKQSWGIEL